MVKDKVLENKEVTITFTAKTYCIVNNSRKPYMSSAISVLTLVHRRPEHLYNLITGLNQSSQIPDELVIVYMNESGDYDLPATTYPVRTIHVSSTATAIPLAYARNTAVARAQHDFLVFLDVDCIPDRDLLSHYREAAEHFSGLLMGEVYYLPPRITREIWDFGMLEAKAVSHPSRPVVRQLVQPEDRYELFWTLNFALSKSTFNQVGGLDEHYQGYGAEDTDFAFTARRLGIPFALCLARAYHQHHPVYRPPLQHFADIVANARYFYQKWQRWPMEGWLEAFYAMQLIDWRATSSTLAIRREPTAEEVAQAYHEAPAGF